MQYPIIATTTTAPSEIPIVVGLDQSMFVKKFVLILLV